MDVEILLAPRCGDCGQEAMVFNVIVFRLEVAKSRSAVDLVINS